MAVTRLKRKEKRNAIKLGEKNIKIKFLNRKPVIKNIDIEAIKKEWAENATASKDKAAKKSKAKEAEATETVQESAAE